MEIIKHKSETGFYDFYIKKENKILSLVFGGNGDLYWIINNQSISPETTKEYKEHLLSSYQELFTITKENYYIYSLFEELIEDIKESRLFLPEDEEQKEFFNIYEHDKLDKSYEEICKEKNEELKKYSRYQLLYNDGVICWHSDEHIFEDADRVKIYKSFENIILDFSRPPLKKDEFIYHEAGRIGIRFRNSGSTYDPFNVIFMRMFHKLQEYDPNYHQIHLEELKYHKKTLNKKQSN